MRGSNVQSLVKNSSQTSLDLNFYCTISIAHYATQMFCQKSDSALLSSCYGAYFRGTRVWTCSQLNAWALIKRRGGGGVLISNIAHEGGA